MSKVPQKLQKLIRPKSGKSGDENKDRTQPDGKTGNDEGPREQRVKGWKSPFEREGDATPGDDDYDPWAHRELQHPISYWMALIHFLKGCLGSGILGMGLAVKHGGWLFGFIATPLTAMVLVYSIHLLLRSAFDLYRRLHVPALDYASVAKEAYANGPQRVQKYQTTARLLVDIMMSINLLGTCCSYLVFIAKTMMQIVQYYHPDFVIDIRLYILMIYPPMVFLVLIKPLRFLVPLSLVANILLAAGTGITLSYCFHNPHDWSDLAAVAPIGEIPMFFGIMIFALEGIGMVMPLENNMKDGRQFAKAFGVFNIGMIIVTALYLFVGESAYRKYGEEVKGSLTLNLPTEDVLAVVVKAVVAAAIFLTFFIQFYVPMDIIERAIERKREKKLSTRSVMTYREIIMLLIVLVAVAVPQLGPVLSVIGCFCLSCLGIIFPAAIDLATFYEERQKNRRKRIIHTTIDSLIIAFGFLVLIIGTYVSVQDIIVSYFDEDA